MQTELSSSGFFLPFSGSCPVHKRDPVCLGRTTRSKESQGQPEHISLPPPAKAYRETSAAKHKMRVRRTVPRGALLGFKCVFCADRSYRKKKNSNKKGQGCPSPGQDRSQSITLKMGSAQDGTSKEVKKLRACGFCLLVFPSQALPFI